MPVVSGKGRVRFVTAERAIVLIYAERCALQIRADLVMGPVGLVGPMATRAVKASMVLG